MLRFTMNNKSVSIGNTDILEKSIKFNQTDEEFIIDCLKKLDKLHTIIDFFKISEYNFYQFFSQFDIKSNGSIVLNNENKSEEFIILNSLLISYLASSRTLIDLLQSFDKKNSMDRHFKHTYDNNFYYQLMYTLRNFALHGHIPIYFDGRRYSFNLEYILKEGEHFNFNKSAKNSLEKIKKIIFEEQLNIANIDFYTAITEYHRSLLMLIKLFFEEYRIIFKEQFTKYKELLKKFKSNNDLLYLYLNKEVHSVQTIDMVKWINSLYDYIQKSLSFFDQQFS